MNKKLIDMSKSEIEDMMEYFRENMGNDLVDDLKKILIKESRNKKINDILDEKDKSGNTTN